MHNWWLLLWGRSIPDRGRDLANHHVSLCDLFTSNRSRDHLVDSVQWRGIVLVAGDPKRCVDGAITRTCCGRCGTKLSYRDDERGETDVTVSSVDRFHSIPSPETVDNDHVHSETRIEMASNAE